MIFDFDFKSLFRCVILILISNQFTSDLSQHWSTAIDGQDHSLVVIAHQPTGDESASEEAYCPAVNGKLFHIDKTLRSTAAVQHAVRLIISRSVALNIIL